jgi:hypothetical protein
VLTRLLLSPLTALARLGSALPLLYDRPCQYSYSQTTERCKTDRAALWDVSSSSEARGYTTITCNNARPGCLPMDECRKRDDELSWAKMITKGPRTSHLPSRIVREGCCNPCRVRCNQRTIVDTRHRRALCGSEPHPRLRNCITGVHVHVCPCRDAAETSQRLSVGYRSVIRALLIQNHCFTSLQGDPEPDRTLVCTRYSCRVRLVSEIPCHGQTNLTFIMSLRAFRRNARNGFPHVNTSSNSFFESPKAFVFSFNSAFVFFCAG